MISLSSKKDVPLLFPTSQDTHAQHNSSIFIPTRSLNLPKHRFLWKSHQMVGEMEGWIKDFPPASWVFFLNPIPHSFWCRVNSFNAWNCINLCGLLIQESTSNSVSTSGNTQKCIHFLPCRHSSNVFPSHFIIVAFYHFLSAGNDSILLK